MHTEPFIEMEGNLEDRLACHEWQLMSKKTIGTRRQFWINLALCVILGIFTIREPVLLPYFLILSILTTGLLIYQQFLMPWLQEKRMEKLVYYSAFLLMPGTLRFFEDRLEFFSGDGEKAVTCVFSYPYQFLTEVIETQEHFLLYYSAHNWIPVEKCKCSLTQQKELHKLLSRYCKNYKFVKIGA